MSNHPSCEDIPPDVQPKPPLAQLKPRLLLHLPGSLGEQVDPHLATTTFYVVVESGKISLESDA